MSAKNKFVFSIMNAEFVGKQTRFGFTIENFFVKSFPMDEKSLNASTSSSILFAVYGFLSIGNASSGWLWWFLFKCYSFQLGWPAHWNLSTSLSPFLSLIIYFK